jgi:anti-sigma-28 factor FlgM
MKKRNQDRTAICPLPPWATYAHPQLTALVTQKAELRAQRVQQLKKQIAEGTYHIDAADVARGIARREIPRLFYLARGRSHREN